MDMSPFLKLKDNAGNRYRTVSTLAISKPRTVEMHCNVSLATLDEDIPGDNVQNSKTYGSLITSIFT